MTPGLHKYLSDWLHWRDNGAPDGEPFCRMRGLCTQVPVECMNELEQLLERDFGKTFYPFGHDEYWERYKARTQHECPKRLAWVRKALADARPAKPQGDALVWYRGRECGFDEMASRFTPEGWRAYKGGCDPDARTVSAVTWDALLSEIDEEELSQ